MNFGDESAVIKPAELVTKTSMQWNLILTAQPSSALPH
jgi:hypothetical protein